ncbi:MAG: molybdate ABC transporter substrate-binding protein [Pikeienuella sp.]|uniref:molybdate ABC transporter substrate-binding protein n=1 Tax=Pikeienuella sp. TaxID=2831957 RepID=UPI00391A0551
MPSRFAPAALAAALCLGAATVAAAEVVVFAAASMKTALDEFAAKWMEETGHSVVVSYAGSNALARQIIEGAPADIFLSAAVEWMDEVEKAGLLAEGTRTDLFGNSLVLVAHGKDVPAVAVWPGLDLAGMLGEEKLAMALVEAVPAGRYGKAALVSLGLWESVAPSVAQADNVRAALALVSIGEAPFGVVYATDAAADDNVSVVGVFLEGSHPPIVYPGALLADAGDEADRAFFAALRSPEAKAAFAAQGFAILD